MRTFTEREKNIFIVLIISIVIFTATQFMIGPLQEEIDSLNESIDAKLGDCRKQIKSLKKNHALEGEFFLYQDTFRQDKTDEETLADFLSKIEKVSSQLGLTLSDLKPKKIRKENSFNEFSASLTLQSEFIDVVEFVSVLQRPPYIFNVEEIKIESISRRNEGLVRTRLNLSKIFIPKEL